MKGARTMHWLRVGAEHFTLSLTREDLIEIVRGDSKKLADLRWLCQMVVEKPTPEELHAID